MRKLDAGEIASSQAVRASLPFFGCVLVGVGAWELYVVEWRAGVRERVTRSAIGASDTGRWSESVRCVRNVCWMICFYK